MHSSRMCTERSSSCLQWGVCLSACWDTPPPPPPWCGIGEPPWCEPKAPPDVGLEPPPCQTPQLPPWVWAWRPPMARPLKFPPGVGLETCMVCWDTIPGDLQGMLGYHLQGMLGYYLPLPP